jgi:hypothetical protein
MDGKIVRVPFEQEEAYYIFNCLLELIYLDFQALSKDPKNLSTLISIAQYLGNCPCKSCRDDTTFSAWLKIIRNQSKDNFYRMKPTKKEVK